MEGGGQRGRHVHRVGRELDKVMVDISYWAWVWGPGSE